MIKKNNQTIGFIYKNNQNIDKIYKNNQLLFEQGFVREDSGNVPLSTTLQAIGKNLKDYKIYGNSVQDGTPTPSAPIEIESVGDRTANILDKNLSQIGFAGQYIKFNGYTPDGKLWSQISVYTGQSSSFYVTKPISIKSNTTYSYSGFQTANNPAYIFLEEDQATIINGDVIRGSGTFVTPSNAKYIVMSINSSYVDTMMLKEGQITGYEPYGYKIPVMARGKNLFDINNLQLAAASQSMLNDSSPIVENNILKLGGLYGSNIGSSVCIYSEDKSNITFSFVPKFSDEHSYYQISGFDNLGVSQTNRIRIGSCINDTFQTVTINNNNYKYIGIAFYSDTKYGISVYDLQIETGNEATPHEPYATPVTTNIYLDEPLRKIGDYADYIDFNNKKIVRNIGKKVLDGSENWTLPSAIISGYSSYRIISFFPTAPVNQLLSSHFECFPKTVYNTNPIQDKLTSYAQTNQLVVVISNSIADSNNQTSTTNFTTWLSNNNVDVYFSQDTVEETITLPNIPTIKGTTIFEIDTEIQPSSMYIKYKGK